MAQSGSQTMAEGLNKLIATIAQLTILPDADLEFLTGLQTAITQYLRQPTNMAGNPDPNQPAQMQQLSAQSGIGPGMGGASMGMGMPNPDEMRRMLSAGNPTGG